MVAKNRNDLGIIVVGRHDYSFTDAYKHQLFGILRPDQPANMPRMWIDIWFWHETDQNIFETTRSEGNSGHFRRLITRPKLINFQAFLPLCIMS